MGTKAEDSKKKRRREGGRQVNVLKGKQNH